MRESRGGGEGWARTTEPSLLQSLASGSWLWERKRLGRNDRGRDGAGSAVVRARVIARAPGPAGRGLGRGPAGRSGGRPEPAVNVVATSRRPRGHCPIGRRRRVSRTRPPRESRPSARTKAVPRVVGPGRWRWPQRWEALASHSSMSPRNWAPDDRATVGLLGAVIYGRRRRVDPPLVAAPHTLSLHAEYRAADRREILALLIT
jgi:hypothetical protein